MKKLLFLILNVSFVYALPGNSTIRLDPHTYGSPRGNEPTEQMVGLLKVKANEDPNPDWALNAHIEAEVRGRRDVSIDLDRAWYRLPLATNSIYLGRIHPYDVSGHPAASSPWGLLSSREPQNYGLLLGYGYESQNTPSPLLMGWLGAHFSTQKDSTIQFSFSASPVFLPSMGSEVSLSSKETTHTGRFGRRPPSQVVLDSGANIPIRYEVDSSNVASSEVIFQPQLMAQLKVQSDSLHPEHEGYLTVNRSPTPNPTFDTNEYLVVEKNDVYAVARVRPKFPQRLTGTYTQVWNLSLFPALHPSLFGSLSASDDKRWGYEAGVNSDYLRFSFLNEMSYGETDKAYSSSEASYRDSLLMLDAQLPLSLFTLYGGVKRHLKQSDLWWRNGIRAQLTREILLDTGFDIFAGDDSSYFGEWRTNDRLYLSLSVQL